VLAARNDHRLPAKLERCRRADSCLPIRSTGVLADGRNDRLPVNLPRLAGADGRAGTAQRDDRHLGHVRPGGRFPSYVRPGRASGGQILSHWCRPYLHTPPPLASLTPPARSHPAWKYEAARRAWLWLDAEVYGNASSPKAGPAVTAAHWDYWQASWGDYHLGTGLGSGMYASEPSSTLNTRKVMSRRSTAVYSTRETKRETTRETDDVVEFRKATTACCG
jgi:hypothetical protein